MHKNYDLVALGCRSLVGQCLKNLDIVDTVDPQLFM